MNLENYYYIKIMKKVFDEFNINAYLVGGAVRDIILGITPCDFDFAAEVDEEKHFYLSSEIADKLKCKMKYNSYYHTAKFVFNDTDIDFVMAREECYPHVASKPIVKHSSMLEDLKRRDYTVNAIAISVKDLKLYDPLNGLKDLNDKKLRIMHDKSFEDDPTRILRGIKYASRLGFDFEEHTDCMLNDAIKNNMLQKLSPEVFMCEIESILNENNIKNYIKFIKKYSVLDCMCEGNLNIYENFNNTAYKNLKTVEKILVLLFNNSKNDINSIVLNMGLKKDFIRYTDELKNILSCLTKSDDELYKELFKMCSRINLNVLDAAFGLDFRVQKFIKFHDKINIDMSKISNKNLDSLKEIISASKAEMLKML